MEDIKAIDCKEIYLEEMAQRTKTLKRFAEKWMNLESKFDTELFQYADPEYYYYRFAIRRQEYGTIKLLLDILYRVMKEYKIAYESYTDGESSEFFFSISNNVEKIGFRFEDFFRDDDISKILRDYRVDKAVIIRPWKSGRHDERVSKINKKNKEKGINVETISLEVFFERYFSINEYKVFLSCLDNYLQESREIIGYKPIKFLSSMNMALQKAHAEKELLNRANYEKYRYQIVDVENEKVKEYRYLLEKDIPITEIINNYLDGEIYRTMLGNNEYAESFMTSEWLFHSLEGERNFDFTAIISGYLKSIEQLLFQIVMLNVGNNCKIAMTNDKKIREKAFKNNVLIYNFDEKKNTFKEKHIDDIEKYKRWHYPYINMTIEQIQYMDSSIGTFEHFLRKNQHLCINSDLAETIADMICCFRVECRNGYFHTHNLKDWNIVKIARSNAIYLYCILLGAYEIPKNKIGELGIIYEDKFVGVCKQIREFSHYNTKFIFVYRDGSKQYLEYDHQNNTIEFDSNGVEYYERLFFYERKETVTGSNKEYVKKDMKVIELTRSTMPEKIFGVYRNGEYEEILY